MDNIENTSTELQSQNTSEIPEQVTYQDVKEGKADFFSLSREERVKIEKEALQNLSEKEKEAHSQGWTPKEFFKGLDRYGNPKEWVDADQFLDKIEKIAPIKNERMRELAKERDSYRSEIEAMQKQIKALTEINKAKIERELLMDEKAVNKELAEAEEYGDVSKYKEASEKKDLITREKLRLKTFEEPPVPPKLPLPQELKAEVSAWAAKNPEIVGNAAMLGYAQKLDAALAIDPDTAELSLSERLEIVEERTKAKFPSYFTKRPALESNKNAGNFGSKPKQASFNDLSAEDKRQAHYLIKKGVYKNETDYMKFMNSIK